jgi:tetratricopeptide (TPR) repeat protein
MPAPLDADSRGRVADLARALGRTSGFALYVVVGAGAARAEVLRCLREAGWVPAATLSGEAGARALLAMRGVRRLSSCLLDDTGGLDAVLPELNAAREDLGALVDGPLVVLVDERTRAALERSAPDLSNVRRDTFVMVGEPVLREGEADLAPCPADRAARWLATERVFETAEGELPSIREHLSATLSRFDALDLAHWALDATLSAETRRAAACELEPLLAQAETRAFVERVLLSGPLEPPFDPTTAPGSADLPAFAALIDLVTRTADAVERVAHEVDVLPDALVPKAGREALRGLLAREGVLRDFSVELAATKHVAASLLVALGRPALRPVQAALRELGKALGLPAVKQRQGVPAADLHRPDATPDEVEPVRHSYNRAAALAHAQALKTTALQRLRAGQREEADRTVKDLVTHQLRHGGREYLAKSLSDLGHRALALGQLEAALAWCEMALSHRPTDVVAQTGRAEVLRAMGRLDEALAAYDAAMRNHPEDVVARNGRAEVLRAMGRLDEALAAYEATLRDHPRDEYALVGRAVVLSLLGRRREANASLPPAGLQGHGAWVAAHVRLINHIRLGEHDLAEAIARSVWACPFPDARDRMRATIALWNVDRERRDAALAAVEGAPAAREAAPAFFAAKAVVLGELERPGELAEALAKLGALPLFGVARSVHDEIRARFVEHKPAHDRAWLIGQGYDLALAA